MAKGESTRNMKFIGVDSTLTRPKVVPPPELSKSAKVYWERIVENVPNDYFNPADFVVLVSYVKNYEMMIKAQDMLDEQGEVIADSNGRPFPNPWFVIFQTAAGKIATLSTKVRLCPSSRMKNDRVKEKVPEGESTTALGKLLNG